MKASVSVFRAVKKFIGLTLKLFGSPSEWRGGKVLKNEAKELHRTPFIKLS
jgi:hypothetical protein